MRNRFMTTTTNHAFFIAVITICLTATVTSFSELPPFVIQRFRYCCRDLDRYSYRNHHITLFSKWDHIIDEDDDDDDLKANIPIDMRYIPRNVVRQNQNFVAIREVGGPSMTNDVYAREPNSSVFWFCGKVARVSDVTVEQAIARQWPIIQQHAANLRPLELYPHRGKLDLWIAPGDSEMEVVYNNPNSIFLRMDSSVDNVATVNKMLIGFQGEMYDSGEEGFRTLRTDDGRPLKPEIVVTPDGGSTATGTPEDMERLMSTMSQMDLNKLYMEQEKRDGRNVVDFDDDDDEEDENDEVESLSS